MNQEIVWLGVKLGDWLQAVESFGIIVSIAVATYSIWSQIRSQRVSNYMNLTAFHREIWTLPISRPELRPVFDVSFEKPLHEFSFEESQFLSFMFLHASSAFALMKDKGVVGLDGMRIDVINTLSLPGPRTFWEGNRKYYSRDFQDFVERCIKRE
jgi:hypothetical protein